eukprot:3348543-Rhodomonas_salina.2
MSAPDMQHHVCTYASSTTHTLYVSTGHAVGLVYGPTRAVHLIRQMSVPDMQEIRMHLPEQYNSIHMRQQLFAHPPTHPHLPRTLSQYRSQHASSVSAPLRYLALAPAIRYLSPALRLPYATSVPRTTQHAAKSNIKLPQLWSKA